MDNQSSSTSSNPDDMELPSSSSSFHQDDAIMESHSPSARSLEMRRSLQYTTGNFAAIMIGPLFSFGILAFPLSENLHMSSTQLNIVTSIGYIWSYFSVPAGLILDCWGSRATIAIGFSFVVAGWTSLALIFYIADTHPDSFLAVPGSDSHAQGTTVALVTFCFSLCTTLGGFADPGFMLPTMTAYNRNQGESILTTKTLMGLGSSLTGMWYTGFFGARIDGKTMSSYFFLIAGLSIVVGISTAYFSRAHDTRKDPSSPFSRYMFNVPMPKLITYFSIALLCALTAYILTTTISIQAELINGNPVSKNVQIVISVIATVIFCGYLLVPLLVWFRTPKNKSAVEVAEKYETKIINQSENESALVDRNRLKGVRLWDSIRNINFFILAFAFFVAFGGGTALVSNSFNMYIATLDDCQGDSKTNAMLVILDGAGSAIGRICAGGLQRLFRRAPPTTFLPLALILQGLSAGIYLLSFLNSNLLYLFMFIHGFGFGCMWGFAPLTVVHLYKGPTLGLHFGAIMLFAMVSSPIFQLLLVSEIYDAAGVNADKCCLGFKCYGISAVVIGCLALFSAVLCVWLHFRVVRDDRKFKQLNRDANKELEHNDESDFPNYEETASR